MIRTKTIDTDEEAKISLTKEILINFYSWDNLLNNSSLLAIFT